MSQLTGVFDNPHTMARERWKNGELVEALAASVIRAIPSTARPPAWTFDGYRPWGTYPSPDSAISPSPVADDEKDRS